MALLLASYLVGWLRLAGPLGSDLEVLLCLAVNFFEYPVIYRRREDERVLLAVCGRGR